MGKAYNVMAATCPSRTASGRGGRCFAVNALEDGPMRFTELIEKSSGRRFLPERRQQRKVPTCRDGGLGGR